MATVMAWYNSEGCKGRCDAKCHNALKSGCHCMCGGRYHGANQAPPGDGLKDRMEKFGAEVLEGAQQRARAEGFELKANSLADCFNGKAKLVSVEMPLFEEVINAALG